MYRLVRHFRVDQRRTSKVFKWSSCGQTYPVHTQSSRFLLQASASQDKQLISRQQFSDHHSISSQVLQRSSVSQPHRYPGLPALFVTQAKFKHKLAEEHNDTTPKDKLTTQNEPPTDDQNKQDGEITSPGIFQRFKLAYKEYGKVLIGVHLATSAVWFGSFYYLALSGIDVIALLQKIGISESVLEPISKRGVGELAVAYLMYKVATPARYTVTIGGTQLTVRYLRKLGYMKPVAKEDSIRNLVREGRSKVQTQMKDKREEFRDRVDVLKDKYKDTSKEDAIRNLGQEGRTKVQTQIKDKREEFRDSVDGLKDDYAKTKKNSTASGKKH